MIVFALLLSASSNAMSASSWLCTGDQAVGFAKEKDDWYIAKFKPSAKYVIKPLPQDYYKYLSGPSLELKYGAFEFGKAGPSYCQSDFLYKETWVCGSYFYFNRNILRFLRFFEGGYVHSLQNTDTPNIEIGTCAILE